MGVIVAAVLAAGMLWNTAVIVFFVAALAAGAAYELISNAAGIKNAAAVTGACIYAFAAVCLLLGPWAGVPYHSGCASQSVRPDGVGRSGARIASKI